MAYPRKVPGESGGGESMLLRFSRARFTARAGDRAEPEEVWFVPLELDFVRRH
jgi:hypothetical protein